MKMICGLIAPNAGTIAVGGKSVADDPDQVREICLLYTSDAADERSSVDLGGRRIIKKKKQTGEEGARYDEQQ